VEPARPAPRDGTMNRVLLVVQDSSCPAVRANPR